MYGLCTGVAWQKCTPGAFSAFKGKPRDLLGPFFGVGRHVKLKQRQRFFDESSLVMSSLTALAGTTNAWTGCRSLRAHSAGMLANSSPFESSSSSSCVLQAVLLCYVSKVDADDVYEELNEIQ